MTLFFKKTNNYLGRMGGLEGLQKITEIWLKKILDWSATDIVDAGGDEKQVTFF